MKIKVDSQLKPKLVIIDNFSGKTFGELKPILVEQGLYTDGMKVMVGSTHTTLEIDSAQLPDLDEVILFITPRDTKAGSYDNAIAKLKDVLKEVEEVEKHELTVSTEDKVTEITKEGNKIQKELILSSIKTYIDVVETLLTKYYNL